jgi:hypothetical protein
MRSPMAARTASSAPALVLCDDLHAAAARLRRGLHLLHRLGLLLPCSLALVLGRAGLVELPQFLSRLVMRGDGADAEEGWSAAAGGLALGEPARSLLVLNAHLRREGNLEDAAELFERDLLGIPRGAGAEPLAEVGNEFVKLMFEALERRCAGCLRGRRFAAQGASRRRRWRNPRASDRRRGRSRSAQPVQRASVSPLVFFGWVGSQVLDRVASLSSTDEAPTEAAYSLSLSFNWISSVSKWCGSSRGGSYCSLSPLPSCF